MKEIVHLRTPRSKTYDRGDGRHVLRTYVDQVHYLDEAHELVEIDASFLEEGGAYKSQKNSVHCSIPKTSKAHLSVTLHRPNGQGITWTLLGAKVGAAAKSMSGDTIKCVQHNTVSSDVDQDFGITHIAYNNSYKFAAEIRVPVTSLYLEKKLTLSSGLRIRNPLDQGSYLPGPAGEFVIEDEGGALAFIIARPHLKIREGAVAEDEDTWGIFESCDHSLALTGKTLTYKKWTTDIGNSLLTKADYYPVIFDADTFYATTNDGGVYHNNVATTWSACRGAATGTGFNTTAAYTNGFLTAQRVSTKYFCCRYFCDFDTSALPDTANITAASLFIRGYQLGGANACAIEGTHTPGSLGAADFDSFGNTACFGHTSSWVYSTTFNEIVLDSNGQAHISKTGTTKFCVREYEHDQLNSAPTDGAAKSGAYFAEQGAGYIPYLEVTYTTTVAKTLTAKYDILLGKSLTTPYDLYISQTGTHPYDLHLAQTLTALYDLYISQTGTHPYDIVLAFTAQTLTALYDLYISQTGTHPYDIVLAFTAQTLTAKYDILCTPKTLTAKYDILLGKSLTTPYDLYISQTLTTPYDLYISQTLTTPYDIIAAFTAQTLTAKYDILCTPKTLTAKYHIFLAQDATHLYHIREHFTDLVESSTALQGINIPGNFYHSLAGYDVIWRKLKRTINDVVWEFSAELNELSGPLPFEEFITTMPDHLGNTHTLFVGFIPSKDFTEQLAANRLKIIGYDAGWYLAQQRVTDGDMSYPDSVGWNSKYIVGHFLEDLLLDGSKGEWQKVTGVYPYRLHTPENYGHTSSGRDYLFTDQNTKQDGIDEVRQWEHMVFHIKPRQVDGVWVPAAYLVHEDDIDDANHGLDLPTPVTITKGSTDGQLIAGITSQYRGDTGINRVIVLGSDTDGVQYTYTAESAAVTAGDVVPREYWEYKADWSSSAKVIARANALLAYFQDPGVTYKAAFELRTDLELMQKIKFMGYTTVPEEWMRIIGIQYYSDYLGVKVDINFMSDKALGDKRRIERSLEADDVSEMQTIVRSELGKVLQDAVVEIKSISGSLAVVTTERSEDIENVRLLNQD